MTFFNEVGAKKQGCKNTAPKNFNHIFIEKPSTNFNNLEGTLISEFVNAIFFLVNVAKSSLNDGANHPLTSKKHPQDKYIDPVFHLLPAFRANNPRMPIPGRPASITNRKRSVWAGERTGIKPPDVAFVPSKNPVTTVDISIVQIRSEIGERGVAVRVGNEKRR